MKTTIRNFLAFTGTLICLGVCASACDRTRWIGEGKRGISIQGSGGTSAANSFGESAGATPPTAGNASRAVAGGAGGGGESNSLSVAGASPYLGPACWTQNTVEWGRRASMPTARVSLGAAVVNGLIYAIGGTTAEGTSISVVEMYNPNTDAWTARTPMPTPRENFATVAYGGLIYAIHGFRRDGQTNEVTATPVTEIYDPVADSWTIDPTIPPWPGNMALESQLFADGTVLNGDFGYISAVFPYRLYQYKNGAATWLETTNVPTELSADGINTTTVDNKLFVIESKLNGSLGATRLATFDASDSQWSIEPSVPLDLGVKTYSQQAIGSIGDSIYVVGGNVAGIDGATNVTGRVYRFTTGTHQWNIDSALPSARHSVSLATVDDTLYVMGGLTAPSLADGVTNEVLAGRIDAHSVASGETTHTFAVGSRPIHLALGDVNDDGRMDVVIVHQSPNGVLTLLLGNGEGTAFEQRDVEIGPNPTFAAIGDLDGDGRNDDIAVAYGESGGTIGVSVLVGSENGTFAPVANYTVTDQGSSAANFVGIGDLNGDRSNDLVIAAGALYELLGTSSGKYAAASTGIDARSAVLTDINRDGKYDIVKASTSRQSGGTSSVCHLDVLLGNGDASFLQAAIYPGHCTDELTAADINRDGRVDLFDGITTFIQNPDGTFGTAATQGTAAPFAVADLNGDVLPDLVTSGGGFARVHLGQGNGAFTAPVSFPVGRAPNAIAVGDVNGDLRPDLAVVNTDDGSVSILLSSCR